MLNTPAQMGILPHGWMLFSDPERTSNLSPAVTQSQYPCLAESTVALLIVDQKLFLNGLFSIALHIPFPGESIALILESLLYSQPDFPPGLHSNLEP